MTGQVYESLKQKQINEEKSTRDFVLYLLVLVLVFGAVLTLNTYVFIGVKVLGASMRPTLETGDILTVNKLATPNYGDIIIVSGKKANDWLIKRVIGLGGDKIEIKADGYVYRNGEKLIEDHDKYGTTEARGRAETILAENEIFFLGDNRGNSNDSRYYGACTEEQVVGVVTGLSLSMKEFNNFMYGIFH